MTTIEFTPTKTMLRRHEKYANESVESFINLWRENGELGLDEQPDPKITNHLHRMLRLTFKPQWMHPANALAELISGQDVHDLPDTDIRKIRHFDAMRTRSGLSKSEWTALSAKVFGVTPHTIRQYDLENDTEDTELYRAYDKYGTLLYIGISSDAANRMNAHEKHSEWHEYMDHYEVELIPQRRDAYKIEAQAIRTEQPIFNLTASNLTSDDRFDYTMEYFFSEPDTLF
jgi:predicted GIY-YIG superfamily endonuclease